MTEKQDTAVKTSVYICKSINTQTANFLLIKNFKFTHLYLN